MARKRGGLPRDLMNDVSWSISGEAFPDRAAFVEAVRAYAADVEIEEDWKPDEVVLPCPRVRITAGVSTDLKPIAVTTSKILPSLSNTGAASELVPITLSSALAA